MQIAISGEKKSHCSHIRLLRRPEVKQSFITIKSTDVQAFIAVHSQKPFRSKTCQLVSAAFNMPSVFAYATPYAQHAKNWLAACK